jgi:hypothetical protein
VNGKFSISSSPILLLLLFYSAKRFFITCLYSWIFPWDFPRTQKQSTRPIVSALCLYISTYIPFTFCQKQPNKDKRTKEKKSTNDYFIAEIRNLIIHILWCCFLFLVFVLFFIYNIIVIIFLFGRMFLFLSFFSGAFAFRFEF